MSERSTIEWTDATWNPVRGCTKVSPGCAHCYAETFAERFRGVPGHPYEQGFDLRLVPGKLGEPLSWRKPRRVFVNSMSDLFHKDVPDDYIAAVFGVMAMCPQHTFQILTKRAERLPRWFDWLKREYNGPCGQNAVLQTSLGDYFPGSATSDEVFEAMLDADWPLPNIWLGVSVEDRKHGLQRLEHLRAAPAAVRFLSVEPLIEDLGPIDLVGIHWVICGGESGPGARPMHPDWARSVRDQCVAAGVPYFFKQWGEWAPCQRLRTTWALPGNRPIRVLFPDGGGFDYASNWDGGGDGTAMARVGKKAAGRLLDGREWSEYPRP